MASFVVCGGEKKDLVAQRGEVGKIDLVFRSPTRILILMIAVRGQQWL